MFLYHSNCPEKPAGFYFKLYTLDAHGNFDKLYNPNISGFRCNGSAYYIKNLKKGSYGIMLGDMASSKGKESTFMMSSWTLKAKATLTKS